LGCHGGFTGWAGEIDRGGAGGLENVRGSLL